MASVIVLVLCGWHAHNTDIGIALQAARTTLLVLVWYSKTRRSPDTGDESTSHLDGTLQADKTQYQQLPFALTHCSLSAASTLWQGKVTRTRQGLPRLGLLEAPSRLVCCTIVPSLMSRPWLVPKVPHSGILSLPWKDCVPTLLFLCYFKGVPHLIPVSYISQGHHLCASSGKLLHWNPGFSISPLRSSLIPLHLLPCTFLLKVLLDSLLRGTACLSSRTYVVVPNSTQQTIYRCCWCLFLSLRCLSLSADRLTALPGFTIKCRTCGLLPPSSPFQPDRPRLLSPASPLWPRLVPQPA